MVLKLKSSMKPLYIFDLDGTLALIEHRRPILYESSDPERWSKFFAACEHDLPNLHVLHIFDTLLRSGAEILIWSARSDEVREKTLTWLANNTSCMSWELDRMLTMREAKDYTPNTELKRLWLSSMLIEDRQRLVAVFDDRDSVVAMWRQEGVTCLQVATGNF